MNVPFLPFQSVIVESDPDLVFDMPMPYSKLQSNRVAILRGEHREQILAVYTSIAYRDFRLRSHLLALAESGGILTAWFAPFDPDLEKHRRLVQLAADNALRPHYRWKVAQLQIVAMRDGLVDVDALPAESPLYRAAAVHGLGTVSA